MEATTPLKPILSITVHNLLNPEGKSDLIFTSSILTSSGWLLELFFFMVYFLNSTQ